MSLSNEDIQRFHDKIMSNASAAITRKRDHAQNAKRKTKSPKKRERNLGAEEREEKMKAALTFLLNGMSTRAAAEKTGLKKTSVMRSWRSLFSENWMQVRADPKKKAEALQTINSEVTCLRVGNPNFTKALTPKEEEWIASLVKEYGACGLKSDVEQAATLAAQLCAKKGIVQTFGRNWKERFRREHGIGLNKQGNIDKKRAAAATEKVRDEQFARWRALLTRLVDEGKLPKAALTDAKVLAPHLFNFDETANGGINGKRRKGVISKDASKNLFQNVIITDGDKVRCACVRYVCVCGMCALPYDKKSSKKKVEPKDSENFAEGDLQQNYLHGSHCCTP
jgi:hypothetical protein